MDIAKYIGLFLLKNHFCYIHGLGNLELKKKPATYDGNELQPPKFDVVLTPTGSIDDTLANFIATNEQTSISKASNSLREFSIQSRTDLKAGKEIVIPSIGKFVEENSKIRFITDPQLQKKPVPVQVQQITKRQEEPTQRKYSTAPKHNSTTINWGKIIIWILILGVVITAIIFAIRLIPHQENEVDTPKAVTTPQETITQQPKKPDSTSVDSLKTTNLETITATGNMLNYKILLNEYDNLARAEKREKQLLTYGNNVELITKDSSAFFVVMPINSLTADTAHVLDSIRKKFNPSGVSIYK